MADGFPLEELDTLAHNAEVRFNDKVAEYGPGKNWLGDHPVFYRYHAVRNLIEGEDDDALNYLLFAREIERRMDDDPE